MERSYCCMRGWSLGDDGFPVHQLLHGVRLHRDILEQVVLATFGHQHVVLQADAQVLLAEYSIGRTRGLLH